MAGRGKSTALDWILRMAKSGSSRGHGGRRAGAGRKPSPVELLTYSYKLTPAQAQLLKLWGGGNGSAGIRWLVDAAQALVVKAGEICQ